MNTQIIKEWIATHSPMGIEKLAVKSRVSSSGIRNMLKGQAPKNGSVRWAIARALGVSEEHLFPPVKQKTA